MKTTGEIFIDPITTLVYNGSGISIGYQTVPSGLSGIVIYNGSENLPKNVGDYDLYAYINDEIYTGSATGKLIIEKCIPDVYIQSLNEIYDGTPKGISYYTIPANLNLDIEYYSIKDDIIITGMPINAGAYEVTMVMNDPNSQNWSGNFNFDIQEKNIILYYENLITKFNKKPQPLVIKTIPTGVGFTVYYNGSTDIPVDSGNYLFEVVFDNENFISEQSNGVYSIIGSLVPNSYTLAWGSNKYGNLNIPISNLDINATKNSGLFFTSQEVHAEKEFSAVLTNRNDIIAWGSGNDFGQQNLSNISINNYIQKIKTTNNSTYILDIDGNITGTGYMFASGFVPKLSGIIDFDVADTYGIAILPNNRLTGWGTSIENDFYKIGISGTSNVTKISTNNANCLAVSSGILTGWGTNYFGQIGFAQGRLPLRISGVKKIVSSDHGNLILRENGTLTGFGYWIDNNSESGLSRIVIPEELSGVFVNDVDMSNTHSVIICNKAIKKSSTILCDGGLFFDT